MSVDDPDALARQRWFTIVLSRLAGVAVALVGLVIMGRAVLFEWRVAGLMVTLLGLTLMALVPRSLLRRWRSPGGH